jgi:hypothetical protein
MLKSTGSKSIHSITKHDSDGLYYGPWPLMIGGDGEGGDKLDGGYGYEDGAVFTVAGNINMAPFESCPHQVVFPPTVPTRAADDANRSLICTPNATVGNMKLIWGCVQHEVLQCSYSPNADLDNFDGALAAFNACRSAEPGVSADWPCRKWLDAAEGLVIQAACPGGSADQRSIANGGIGFHTIIPFIAACSQVYHFRFHADNGYIGINDGAGIHTFGDIWGFVAVNDVYLEAGQHYFEGLGFEQCCDGHSELDVMLPGTSTWTRVKVEAQQEMVAACAGRFSGTVGTAQVSIIVDNSHTSYCNGQLIGSASSWNAPDTWPCETTDGNYVIAIDGVDGELVVGSGFGGFMASVLTDDGRRLDFDISWKCWVPEGQVGANGHRTLDPPAGWYEMNLNDNSWPAAVSFGFNTDANTHWYPYIKPFDGAANGCAGNNCQRGGNRNGLAGGVYDPTCDDCQGSVGGGITDEAQWIWTLELDSHNDVYCRGKVDDFGSMQAVSAKSFGVEGRNVQIDGDTLKVTVTSGSQRGEAYAQVDIDSSKPITLTFDMYIGDGSGADGMCANLGNNNLGNRVAENGVTEGVETMPLTLTDDTVVEFCHWMRVNENGKDAALASDENREKAGMKGADDAVPRMVMPLLCHGANCDSIIPNKNGKAEDGAPPCVVTMTGGGDRGPGLGIYPIIPWQDGAAEHGITSCAKVLNSTNRAQTGTSYKLVCDSICARNEHTAAGTATMQASTPARARGDGSRSIRRVLKNDDEDLQATRRKLEEASSYQIVQSGTCASNGGELIADLASCTAAGEALGLTYEWNLDYDSPFVPPGCIYATGSALYFNPRESAQDREDKDCGVETSSTWDCVCAFSNVSCHRLAQIVGQLLLGVFHLYTFHPLYHIR